MVRSSWLVGEDKGEGAREKKLEVRTANRALFPSTILPRAMNHEPQTGAASPNVTNHRNRA